MMPGLTKNKRFTRIQIIEQPILNRSVVFFEMFFRLHSMLKPQRHLSVADIVSSIHFTATRSNLKRLASNPASLDNGPAAMHPRKRLSSDDFQPD
jgi:hypothetical protein